MRPERTGLQPVRRPGRPSPMGLQPVVDAWLIFRRNTFRGYIINVSVVLDRGFLGYRLGFEWYPRPGLEAFLEGGWEC